VGAPAPAIVAPRAIPAATEATESIGVYLTGFAGEMWKERLRLPTPIHK